MTSTNGGRAVSALRERGGDDVTVYVGAPSNARALGRHLADRDRPTYVVSSGSSGEIAVEDHVGAALVSRHVDGLAPSAAERSLYRRQLRLAKGPEYLEEGELRRRDVLEYAATIDERAVVPELRGDALVDVGPGGEPTAADGGRAERSGGDER